MKKIRLDVAQLQLPLSQVAQLLCAVDLEATTFTFLTQSVHLRTNSAVALRWAELALAPYFTVSDAQAPSTCYVIYLSGAEAIEITSPTSEPEQIRMHYGKQGLRWELDTERDLIREAKYNNWYLIDRPTRSVLFVTTLINRATYKEPAILVREMILTPLPAEGYLPLHGSAAALGGSSIAFLGESGSGKTTMLLNFIDRYQADYMANDRFLVRWHEETGQVWLYGTPESCRVGFATMRTIPKLGLYLRIDEHIEGATLPLEDLRYQREGKVAFLPKEISAIMGCSFLLQAPLQVMSCVRLSASQSPQGPSAKMLSQQESKEAIANAVLYPDIEFSTWLRLDIPAHSTWSPALIRTWEAVQHIPIYISGGGETGGHQLEHLLKHMREGRHITVPVSEPAKQAD